MMAPMMLCGLYLTHSTHMCLLHIYKFTEKIQEISRGVNFTTVLGHTRILKSKKGLKLTLKMELRLMIDISDEFISTSFCFSISSDEWLFLPSNKS